MLVRAHHYCSNTLLDLLLDEERISSVSSADRAQRADLQADIIAPAYFDLQINGCMGINFTSASLSQGDIARVVEDCAEQGIAAFCPTVITASDETIFAAMTALKQACETSEAIRTAMPCFHLEGPFISSQDGARGAHPHEYVRHADYLLFQRWQEAAGGRIKLVTLAPEVPGAIKLIEELVKEGLIVSIGHSNGSSTLIREAIAAGARFSTHLGNGCARLLPRHENILWEQLSADTLYASIIPDGHHLPWNLVKCIERCKTLERLIITCDASPLAGLPPGRYSPWGSEVEITPEGKIMLREQGVLAGSWDFTSTCVEKMIDNTSLSYAQVHPLACDQPRRLLGLSVPTLEPQQGADLVLLNRNDDGKLRHTHSFIRGKVRTMQRQD